MCSTGGGNSVLESILDVGVQSGTLGLAGFKSDKGGLTPGVTGKPAIDVTKEITGAKAAEEATELAREQFNEEKANRLRERETAQAANASEQLRLSRQAGSRGAGGVTTTGTRASNIGDSGRDFLGL